MTRLSTLACLVAGAHAANDLDMASAVQAGVRARRGDDVQFGLPRDTFNKSRLYFMSVLNNNLTGESLEWNFDGHEKTEFDCLKHENFCVEPFRCDTWTLADSHDVIKYGIGQRTGVNLRAWCMPGNEHYLAYASKCIVDQDLIDAGKDLFDKQFKSFEDEIDASYCFYEGHCTNQAVTKDTTPIEAEAMCDYRFQHKHWIMNFNQALKKVFNNKTIQTGLISHGEGITTQRVARYQTKLACAMGTFHCDVMYCKETYCKDEYYVNKFKHLLPSVDGHKLKDYDELPKGADLAY